ncbi:MAG: DNA/RNA non-specific endonuclease, partial [Pseudomonadota bacterium]|nr:DNA/RNA non-specific endonuclease [Pseudomonadota bacterium]
MGKSLVHWRRQGRRLGIAVLFVIVGTGLWEFQGRQHQDAYTWQGVPTWEEFR